MVGMLMTAIKERKIDSRHCISPAFFQKIPLFAKLPAEDVAHFADAARVKSYKKGQMLYLEGDQANAFYIVCSGWLKLFHTTEEGEEVVIAMLTKNGVTGESALFEQGRYASNAQVAEAAQIVSIPLSLLKEQLSINNKLAFNMLTSMMQYRRIYELQLEQYLLYSAPQRIGCFLLGLCPVLDQKDGMMLDLPYDKTLIASMLGMKGATFSRALNILREETGIQIAGTRVTIDSMERLLTFVNGCYSHTHLK